MNKPESFILILNQTTRKSVLEITVYINIFYAEIILFLGWYYNLVSTGIVLNNITTLKKDKEVI